MIKSQEADLAGVECEEAVLSEQGYHLAFLGGLKGMQVPEGLALSCDVI